MNMVSGLFRGHAIGQPTPRQINDALDRFAELLSLDLSLPDIADRMMVSRGTACVLLRMLTDKFEWQAA